MAWWRDGAMPSVEERVAYLEGRSEDHVAAIGAVRADVRDVRSDVRDLRGEMIRRLERVDRRVEQVDQRLMWLMGLQFATLLAVISAVLGAYFR